jgi:signal transduction histidine kinase
VITDQVTIMIVDDMPANLTLLREILQGQGYRILAFPRGAMALKAAQDYSPDLILLDINMPEMDGFEVCRHLKESPSLQKIPVLFISANDTIGDKMKAFAMGGVDYVTKPFQVDEVKARVETHLRLRQQQIQLEVQAQQLKQNFEQLRDLEELRDKLIHLMVHDMRSPLTGIMGFADMLKSELNENGQKDLGDMANEILISSFRLHEMISTLLDINRLEAKAMPLALQPDDLRTIASQALRSLSGMAREITLIFTPPATEVSVFCDVSITRRIIENLLGNALKYAGSHGTVGLSIESREGKCLVHVSDSGPGIPEAFQKRIFEKFAQVDARQDNVRRSTGLGLTFCKMAVEAQGGEIGVTSETGRGSKFWFSLPATPK